MSIEIYNEYDPLPWQIRVHQGNWRWIALCGGKGCMAESTEVLTSRGRKAIGDLLVPEAYWSMGPNGYQLAPGTASFPKGKANLYRVIHKQGEFVAAGHHLVAISPGEYQFVQTLEVGQGLIGVGASFEKDLLRTNAEFFHPEFAVNGRRLKQRLEGFLGDYGVGTRLCDPQLLLSLGIGQALFQSPIDVQGFDPLLYSHRHGSLDDRKELELKHSLLGQLFGLQPKPYSSLHNPGLVVALVNRIASKFFGHTSLGVLSWLQSLLTYGFRPKDLESFLSSLIVPPSRNSSLSSVMSIEKLPHEEWYWDLQVRNTNNYIAGGAVHHNSAKTRLSIEELKACALEFPKTNYVIGRKTLPSLKDTTWKEFRQTLPEGMVKDENKTDRIITLVNDSTFLGRSMDEPKKFESLKISGFLIDEADEIEKIYFDTLKTRVREVLRDAHGTKVIPRYRGILAMNPPDDDHWIVQLFRDEHPALHEFVVSSTFDNLDNLPPDYIDTLKSTYTEDMQQRMIHGLPGRVHKGRPVFPEFKRGAYISSFKHDPKLVVWRGWDFGYHHPCVVWLQFVDGQVRVLAEKKGKDVYLDDFIKEQVLPMQNEIFGEHFLWGDWCDPHGSDESDKGKTSVEILNENGIYPKYLRSKIIPGIKSIRDCLNTKTISGDPNFMIHGRCKNLIEAFKGGYYRDSSEDDPIKDGFFDHYMDCLRYVVFSLRRRYVINSLQSRINNQDNVFIHPVTGRRIEQ